MSKYFFGQAACNDSWGPTWKHVVIVIEAMFATAAAAAVAAAVSVAASFLFLLLLL